MSEKDLAQLIDGVSKSLHGALRQATAELRAEWHVAAARMEDAR